MKKAAHPTNPTRKISRCAQCRYDLSDQIAEYIPEFHLMAVRCPECGQRQPSGIVAQPWRYRKLRYSFMLLVWIFVFFAAIGGSIGALFGMAQSTAYASLEPFAILISQVYKDADPEDFRATWTNTLNPRYMVQIGWWENEGKGAVSDDFNLFAHLDWIVLTDWLWFLLIAPVLGVSMRILLIRSRRFAQLIVLSFVLGVSAIFIWSYLSAPFFYEAAAPIYCAIDAAGKWVMWPTYIFGSLLFLISYVVAVDSWNFMARLIPAIPKIPRVSRGSQIHL